MSLMSEVGYSLVVNTFFAQEAILRRQKELEAAYSRGYTNKADEMYAELTNPYK